MAAASMVPHMELHLTTVAAITAAVGTGAAEAESADCEYGSFPYGYINWNK